MADKLREDKYILPYPLLYIQAERFCMILNDNKHIIFLIIEGELTKILDY